MHLSIAWLAVIATNAVAKTITVDVGESGFVFNPDTITAAVGDVVEFHFYGSIHTATQSDFDTPCQMSSSAGPGFNSGPIHNQPDGSVRPFFLLL
jgi:plastocyanin